MPVRSTKSHMRSTRRRIGRQWRSAKKTTIRCPFCWRRTVQKGHYHLLMCRDRARYRTLVAEAFAGWQEDVQTRMLDPDADPQIRIGRPEATKHDFEIPAHAEDKAILVAESGLDDGRGKRVVYERHCERYGVRHQSTFRGHPDAEPILVPHPRKQRSRPPPKKTARPPCMLGLVDAAPAEEASGRETDACEADGDHPLLFLHTRLPRISVAER